MSNGLGTITPEPNGRSTIRLNVNTLVFIIGGAVSVIVAIGGAAYSLIKTQVQNEVNQQNVLARMDHLEKFDQDRIDRLEKKIDQLVDRLDLGAAPRGNR